MIYINQGVNVDTDFYQMSDNIETLINSLKFNLFALKDERFDADLLDVIIHSNPDVMINEMADYYETKSIMKFEDADGEFSIIQSYMIFISEVCKYSSKDRLHNFRKNGMATYIKEHSVKENYEQRDQRDQSKYPNEEENIPNIYGE